MNLMRRSTLPLLLACLVFLPTSALAAEPAPVPDKPTRPRLRVNIPIELTITLGGGVAWITTEALKSKLAPSSCRWCEPPGIDLAVKNALRWQNTKPADITSYVTGFALAPIAAFGLDALVVSSNGGSFGEWGEDALVILESIVVAADVNQLVKFSVGRERPFVHDLSPAEKNKTSQPSDNNLSFFSGHTTLGFSAAVSGGMVATLKGYKSAPYIWATGLTLAAATGYLRIAADRHYFIDVMTGAVWGTAAGLLVPWLHRPGKTKAKESAYGGQVTGLFGAPTFGGSGAVLGVSGVLF